MNNVINDTTVSAMLSVKKIFLILFSIYTGASLFISIKQSLRSSLLLRIGENAFKSLNIFSRQTLIPTSGTVQGGKYIIM